MNIYKKIVAWLESNGYFKIHPVVRRAVIQGFGVTMIASIPFFWGITDKWPVVPLIMCLVLVVKECLDDRNSGRPIGEYMIEHSFKHLLQAWAGILVAVFIMIAVATERGII